MNEPNLIINVSGESKSRSLISVMIANFLKESGIKQVSHVDFDETMLDEIQSAINESKESLFSSVVAVVADWPTEFIEQVYNPESEKENTDEQ